METRANPLAPASGQPAPRTRFRADAPEVARARTRLPRTEACPRGARGGAPANGAIFAGRPGGLVSQAESLCRNPSGIKPKSRAEAGR
jgi:hypothetical protein